MASYWPYLLFPHELIYFRSSYESLVLAFMLYKLLILCEKEPWMKVFMSFWRSSEGHDTEPGVPLSDVAKYAFAVHSPPSVEPKASMLPRICLISLPVLISVVSPPSASAPA